MRPLTPPALFLLVAAIAASSGYLVQGKLRTAATADVSVTEGGGAPILALTLPDTHGTPHQLARWQDKVLVVNFWATWCPPCLREIPEFSRTSQRFAGSAVQFVGISIDTAENVRRFAAAQEVPYPLLIAPLETLDLTRSLGNTAQALPFTAIFDRHGEVRMLKLGTLNEVELERKIRALLAEP